MGFSLPNPDFLVGVDSQDLCYIHFSFVRMLQSWETPSIVVLCNHGRKDRWDWAVQAVPFFICTAYSFISTA